MTDAAKAGRSADGAAPEKVGTTRPADPEAVPDLPTMIEERRSEPSRLSGQAQAHIGYRLRSLYDTILQQPVPDRFRELIERLDAQGPKAP